MTKKDIFKRALIILANITIFLLLLFAYTYYIYGFFIIWKANPILHLSSPILFYIFYRFLIFDWKLNNILSLKGVYSYLLMPILYFLISIISALAYGKFVESNDIYEIFCIIFILFFVPLIICSLHYLIKGYDTNIILKRILLPIIFFQLSYILYTLFFKSFIYLRYYDITFGIVE